MARGRSRITIGRLPENDVVVDDLLVSRHHAVLTRVPDGWSLRDLGSANGTYLNGRRVTEEPAVEGDVIGVGHALLQLSGDRLVEYQDRGDVGDAQCPACRRPAPCSSYVRNTPSIS